MTHAGGRPTKYDPSFVQEVYKYLEMTGRDQTSLPKIESLALHLNVNKSTLYEWAKIYPEFSNALEIVMLKQGEQLIDDGIYGGKEVNATIIKLLLQNNHGMKERTDLSTNDKDMNQPQTVLVKFINGKPDNRNPDGVPEAV
jgi:hypothetical protein